MQRTNPDSSAIKASVTALSVAWGFTRAMATDYGDLFTPQELALSRHLCMIGRQYGKHADFEELCKLPYASQRLFCNKNYIPGYDQVLMLRKLMIKSRIEEALMNGTRQIVLLGGGYDIRALMTSLTHDVKVYELDRGPTRENKLKGVQSIPGEVGLGELKINSLPDGTVIVNDKLYYIECDFLTDNLRDVLTSHHFESDKKTLIIAEGLTAYLDAGANKKLLSLLHGLMKDTDELLISYITKGGKTQVLADVLKAAGEEHRLSLSAEDLIPFVGAHGFYISHQFDATVLLDKIGDAEDAMIYKAEKNKLKEYYIFVGKPTTGYQSIDDVPFYQLPFLEKHNQPVKT